MTRTIEDFARDLAKKLDPYLAIGMRAQDIEWIIVEAMQAEMKGRSAMNEPRKPGNLELWGAEMDRSLDAIDAKKRSEG